MLFRRFSLLAGPIALSVFGVVPAFGESSLNLEPVEKWLRIHAGLRTLQVDFDQQRQMRTLKHPVKSSGRLWLDFKTKNFRWQSGDPPKVIVINDGNRMAIVQPSRKRVEYRPSGTQGSASGAPPGLSVMAGGFPKTLEEFQKEYRVLAIERDGPAFEVRTLPIRGDAAKGVRELTFFIDAEAHYLRGFEIVLKDNSILRSNFRRIVKNHAIPKDTFTVDTEGYKVVENSKS